MADTMVSSEDKAVTVERRSPDGEVVDSVQLDPSVFGVTPNVPLLHQVVTAQLAARRSGTQSTKTRAEVAGGGAKPYRQKGTGRARQGSIRAPHFKGGGVALGPKPRSYAQRTPRKMTRLALCSALSDRASDGRVCVVDEWTFDIPRTKDAIAALSALGLSGHVLVVLGEDSFSVERSFANLPEVELVEASQLTAYDVLANDWVVFSSDTVPGGVTVVEGSKPAKAAARKSVAKKASASPERSPDETQPASPQPDAQPTAPAARTKKQGAAAGEEGGEPEALGANAWVPEDAPSTHAGHSEEDCTLSEEDPE